MPTKCQALGWVVNIKKGSFYLGVGVRKSVRGKGSIYPGVGRDMSGGTDKGMKQHSTWDGTVF